MEHSSLDNRALLHLLFSVAWTDGELAVSEREYLKGLYERLEITGGVSQWFDEPPETPDWNALRADSDTAEAVLRHAMVVAAADDRVAYEETTLMERLRERLGVSETDFHAIQREVEDVRDH